MKQKNILFIFFVTLFAAFACERVDESQLEGNNSTVEKVEMTFTAVIEKEGETKTVLGGEISDNLRKVYWQQEDEIAVIAENNAYNLNPEVSKFVANTASVSESSEFVGTAQLSTRYKAFYPYQSALRDSSNFVIFNLPSEQTYVRNSFDPMAAPMVASAANGGLFKFKNICGVLALQLKGEDKVKSIVFKPVSEPGNPIFVAGDYDVDPFAEGTPEIRFHGNGRQSLTLTCETPVQLDPETPTAFYLVLPPATYERFTIYVTTENGELMIKEGTKPLTVKRADVVRAGALTYVETLPIDLSRRGTANSYIVSGAGFYSFDAGVIGNGSFGLIEGAGFHTDDPSISPVKAEILWQDRDNVIEPGTLSLDTGSMTVSFMTTGREGNVLVAAKDADDNILWSWHIWATDEPKEEVYINSTGSYPMLDRNLGAIAAFSESTDDINGFVYQWGRKDPIRTYNFYSECSKTSIANAVANPNTVYYPSEFEYNPHWQEDDNSMLWTKDQKTIYDPCPVGYKVPHKDVWLSFSKTESYNSNSSNGEVNFSGELWYGLGIYFIYDGTNTTFYPVGTSIRGGEASGNYGDWSEQWTSEASDRSYAIQMEYYYNDLYDFRLSLESTDPMNNALHVRCVKDENHVDMARPSVTVKVTDVTTETAVVQAAITDSGDSPVTARGIIWGTEKGLSLEKGTVVPETQDLIEFNTTLTGLQAGSRYFVRAYATNDGGTAYSKELVIYTPFNGEAQNLSSKGTANTYIVRPVYGEYSFDASVKGNSRESVGQIASVEVLWETTNKVDNLKKGCVLDNVELKGNKVHFRLPFDPVAGNALVAVKDALGTILWSWHIWVVDFDPVETQQTYKSGAIMMDRNLGATTIIPEYGGAENKDYSAFGLYYQWGRKDPLPMFGSLVPENALKLYDNNYPSEANTIEYATKNPTVVYDDVDWNYDNTLWSASKTIYDPCPYGWRVPDMGVWNEWDSAKTGNDDYTHWYSLVESPYSSPNAYYPLGGLFDWNYTWSDNMYDAGYYRVTESDRVLVTYRTYIELWRSIDRARKASVRCMKDVKSSGENEDFSESDDYEWE